ncbi:hypothetical protein BV378_02230 [Nostoc sp. RF31YmG]|jgi:hypothetical protein|nr:hypothetical protein BV378_02230 [Nostoc sp. RF31YmG]
MPPPLPAAPPRGLWSRHWKWIVPLIVLSVLMIFASFAVAIFLTVAHMLKSAEPYRHAVALARQEPQVIAALGEPMQEGWLPMGHYNTAGPSGEAAFDITLRGPRGEGHLYVEARRRAGRWEYPTLSFAPQGNVAGIDLPHDPPAQDASRCEP